MGTNFYWLVEHQKPGNIILPTGKEIYRSSGIDYHDPDYHLGKRSMAGLYCWDCNLTLCKGGNERIHFVRSRDEWSDACLKCGKRESDNFPSRFDRVAGESPRIIAANPAMIELGFSKPNTDRPTGVAGCCSFSWAQDPRKALDIMMARPDEILVEDEYGETYKAIDFLNMLNAQCPVHFEHSIGQQFS